MAEGTDSTFDLLFGGESNVPRLSAAEWQVLTFALDAFGPQLCRFLLAGLGREAGAQRWRFAVSCGGEEGGVYERRIDVITHEPEDGPSLLPRRRDPLVFAALLHLLTRGGRAQASRLDYRQEDVLNLLGWDDSEESRREVDEAMERYARLTYVSEAGPEELRRRGLAGYRVMQVPVTRFATVDEEGEGGATRRVLNLVTFSELFIEGLMSRSLLGIDWDAVVSVKGDGV